MVQGNSIGIGIDASLGLPGTTRPGSREESITEQTTA
ncbi:hypothetical protein ThimaDRAFT_1191 [Thiocapsa marina 5811]|uniref:Uncharacterized protein n=1 Tax=Thiocapsa marina 5811 TaxID=768671 RepID=F9U7W5_9GAMM|nr:hypothetical protein ThimaDRAFT_1191 [Thiocapsa marina 5811]